jgi:pimeloyl-ACP methyl ester carboxylesterase
MTYVQTESTATAITSFTEGPTARFAFRRFGTPSDIPLVLAMRFRGTIDHWDPALLDRLAEEREVIVFDNRGTGASTGPLPTSIDDLAEGLIEFVEALGLATIDLLGWSLGGIAVQAAALKRPDLVRRLIVAGSTPGGVPDQPPAAPAIWQLASKSHNSDEDFLQLFFPDTEAGRQSGLESLRRLEHRLGSPAHAEVDAEAWQAQLRAIGSFDGLWDRLPELQRPVLITNGTDDVMIDAHASYAMSRRVRDAKLVLYSDAGHGFLFQHPEDFAREVNAFLGPGS